MTDEESNPDHLESTLGSVLDPKDLKFLVVDDSSTMRRILTKCLREIGAGRVVEAPDGMEALAKLRTEGPFDVILTDWNMPVMNGLDLLKQIMADKVLRSIPVVMVTTEAEKSNVLEAIKAGARDYVVKPFTAQILKGKIDQTLGRA